MHQNNVGEKLIYAKRLVKNGKNAFHLGQIVLAFGIKYKNVAKTCWQNIERKSQAGVLLPYFMSKLLHTVRKTVKSSARRLP